jgi:hypothetical protein
MINAEARAEQPDYAARLVQVTAFIGLVPRRVGPPDYFGI